MKKIFLFLTSLILCLFVAKAQDVNRDNNNVNKQERIKALYVAYVTQELSLTADEAQKFWPIHAQYENEIRSVKSDMPELDRQQSILNIKKKYQDNFTKILGVQRCNHFFKVDGDFKRKLLNKIRNQNTKPIKDKRPLL